MKNIKIKKIKRTGLLVLAVLFVLMMAAVPVNAKVRRNKWATSSYNNTYYFDKNGKKVTGMKKIGKRYYYFDSIGVQRTGWRKIGGNYYFFNMGKEAKGYRVSSRTINGVELGKDGKAKITGYSSRKLPLMVKANETLQSITKNYMSKEKKLQVAFEYSKNHLIPFSRGNFQLSDSWDMSYAEYAFQVGRADCYSYAAHFAYLANAAGYRATVVSSGGHGWAEIDNRVYDPNWAKFDRVDSYFGMSYDLSGVSGRPLYRQNRVYLKTV